MKVLTDTHTLVWVLPNPEALGVEARTALAESPFLVAQSLAEKLTLVSKDVVLARYGVPVIW